MEGKETGERMKGGNEESTLHMPTLIVTGFAVRGLLVH